MTPFFDLAGQWRLLDKSLRLYRAVSREHMALLAGIFVSCFVGGVYRSIRNAMRQWPLWVPAGAGLAIIALAVRQERQRGVARGLERIGIRPGDRVAQVRMNAGVYWARLAGVQIVAEISGQTAPQFWRADEGVRRETLAAIARTGAKAVVAPRIPMRVGADDWQRVGDTDVHVYLLR